MKQVLNKVPKYFHESKTTTRMFNLVFFTKLSPNAMQDRPSPVQRLGILRLNRIHSSAMPELLEFCPPLFHFGDAYKYVASMLL